MQSTIDNKKLKMNSSATQDAWDDVPAIHADNDQSEDEISDDESGISENDSNESCDSDSDESDDGLDLKDLTADEYHSLSSEERDMIKEMVEKLTPEQCDELENYFSVEPENKINDTFFIDSIPGEIKQGIVALGWDTPIGSQSFIEPAIENPRMNLIINASTGSGKTGFFGVVGASLVNPHAKCPQVLIIVPNRTLAKPIYDVICDLVEFSKITVALHRGIGGDAKNGQVRNATPYMSNSDAPAGTEQIVIATPGKAKALLDPDRSVRIAKNYISDQSLKNNRAYYNAHMDTRGTAVYISLLSEKNGKKHCTVHQCFVDECDQVLKQSSNRSKSSMANDFREIMAALNTKCRYTMVSATASSSPEVQVYMSKFSNKPMYLKNAREKELHDAGYHGNVPFLVEFTVKRSLETSIVHKYVQPELESDKFRWLLHLLKTMRYHTMFVFCNTNECVRRVYDYVIKEERDFPITFIDDSIDQDDKDKALVDLRNGKFRVIVSTDICAFGIDIVSTDMVINFDIPDIRSLQVYPHRAGRAGRKDKKGMCISITQPCTDAGIPPEIDMLSTSFNIHITALGV